MFIFIKHPATIPKMTASTRTTTVPVVFVIQPKVRETETVRLITKMAPSEPVT